VPKLPKKGKGKGKKKKPVVISSAKPLTSNALSSNNKL
jgi:hypothetical protein